MIDFRFYLVTDRSRCAPKTLASVVHDACAMGVRAVQMREKDLHEGDLISCATRLLKVGRPKGARLLVNASEYVDDDTASLLVGSPGVDGFHIPDNAALLAHFRGLFPTLLIGASTHSAEGIRAAAGAGADFVTFGPVFATASKGRALTQGIDGLARACDGAPVPVFAIGGITAERAKACLEAGAHGVAVIGAIMGASSARAAVRAFAEAMGGL